MRIKVSRERGRPSGKYRSLADIRILQYLTLISMKYGVDSEKLFDCFVEAWKHQESTCQHLLIKRRKEIQGKAVFLVTNSRKVVAQFSIPKHILEQTSPLEKLEYVNTLKRTMLEKPRTKALKIGDLKCGMKQINLEARVLEIPKPRFVVTRFGGLATVANASIADDTGIIRLPLWNKQIEAVSEGDLVRVENARVVTFRGERQLKLNRGGELNVIK